jgi:uncharacterized protein (TIGR01777 family)
MRIVIPGGTGQIGGVLTRHFTAAGHDVTVLSRAPGTDAAGRPLVQWDTRTPGAWHAAIDGADVVVNLAGRSVDCRYHAENRRQIMDSRVDSTKAVGEAICAATNPPGVWLQMSTATLYRHSLDADQTEAGTLGPGENDPDTWHFSHAVADAWEAAATGFELPSTRLVLLRSAMMMSPDKGGVFDVLRRLAKLGLGGPIAGGRQYISWIHDADFCRAIDFLIARADLAGPVNLTSPSPLPQREFMKHLRAAVGQPIGLPATAWMSEIGAIFLRTETELILKSRRVTPGRLLTEAFTFEQPAWPAAATNLVRRHSGGT